MTMQLSPWPLVILAATACTPPPSDLTADELPERRVYDTGNGEDTASFEEDTGEVAPPDFSPQGGNWTVTESELTYDGCGLEDKVDRGQPGTTLSLSQGETGFSMLFEAGETVQCRLGDEQGYLCDPTQTIDSTASDLGLNADIPVTITTVGNFSDDANMWMESTVDIGCQGSDCGLIQILLGTSFPCSMTMISDLVAG
jgi:hypothetical protein